MRNLFSILALLFASSPLLAHAACPPGANYTNPANPTGASVTLASLGITSCYFVAANGSDSNDGLSEASGHPWLHAPFMPNCSSVCLTKQNAMNGSSAAGVGIIFRGGDTWHFGASTSPASGGTWEFNSSPYPIGTASNPIYLGVDQTWYTGGSWARPILNADNSPCNASTTGTMPDGYTCTGTTDGFGQPSYHVSGCGYQVGGANILLDISSLKYFDIDNFEMTGICQSGAQQGRNGDDTYIRDGSMCNSACTGTISPLVITNNYIHGASHLAFAGANGSPACNSPAVCINVTAFQGGVPSGNSPVGETIALNVVDFSDSDPGGENLTLGGFYNVAYNAFRYTTQALPNPLHSFHDNLYEYFFENGHSNVIESLEPSNGVIYNNVFRHIENLLSSGGGVFLWPGPQTGVTDYIFNNVAYDVGGLEYFNMGGVGLTTNNGNYTFFNNTFQSNPSQALFGCNGSPIGTVLNTNNHVIDDQNPGTCASMTVVDQLWQTNAVATSNGYTSSQTFAYSPTSSGSPTVGVGANQHSGYCATLSGSSDSFIAAAGAACNSDTPYGISYNATTHTVSYPGRASVGRPSSGAWDIGSYEYAAGGPSYSLTASGTNAAFSGLNCSNGSYSSGTPINCACVPNSGYICTSMSGTGSASGCSLSSCSFSITATSTVSATAALGSISLVSHNFFPQTSGAITCSPTCPAQSISSINAGNLLVLDALVTGNSSAAAYLSSLSCSPSVGTWVFPTQTNIWNNTSWGTSAAYILSTTAAVNPSCTATMSGTSQSISLFFRQYNTTKPGGFSVDNIPMAVNLASCTACAAPNATLTGTNDVVISGGSPPLAFTSLNAPYGNVDIDAHNAAIVGDVLNTTSGTGATANQGSAASATLDTLAFTDSPTSTSYTLTVIQPANGSIVGDGGIDVCSSGTYPSGTVLGCRAVASTYYQFNQWTAGPCNATSTNPCGSTLAADTTITASFSLLDYTVNFNIVGSGSISGCTSGTYNYGSIGPCTAIPGIGYSFTSWSCPAVPGGNVCGPFVVGGLGCGYPGCTATATFTPTIQPPSSITGVILKGVTKQ